ncbi:MAG: hypothetical protein V3T17_04420 [Pseudomonadales bacterium]
MRWEPRKKDQRWLRYAMVGALLLALVWTAVAAYIITAPKYTSRFALVLPGNGSSSKINLEKVGEATTDSPSPFGNRSVNPRVNYKEILLSDDVREAAAHKVGLSLLQFTKPKIKMVAETAIIQVFVKGATPNLAKSQSTSLIDAFNTRLDQLRADEITRREQSIQNALAIYRKRLQATSRELVSFKQGSEYISKEQYAELSMRLERIKEDRVNTLAEMDRQQGYVDQLSRHMGITPKLAADAFVLNADYLFRKNLLNYHESGAQLAVYQSKWGKRHPMVIHALAQQQQTLSAMTHRSLTLVGHQNLNTIKLLNLDESATRSALFEDIILSFAKTTGLNKKRIQLDYQIDKHDKKIRLLARDEAILDDLQRNYQIAEAVFTSAVAKIDTNKADIYASYPLVQILAEPSLPRAPSSPNRPIALVGGILGSCLIIVALTMLWKRKQLLQKIAPRNGFGSPL